MQEAIKYKNVITKQDSSEIATDIKSQLSFFDDSYFDFIKIYSEAEGWFGNEYIYFWNPNEIVRLNKDYNVSEYIQNICIFASDRCGNALAINVINKEILKVPFIPMDIQYKEISFQSFSHFIEFLNDSEYKSKSKNKINKNTFGKEIFEKHPIVLGGDPNDKSNKVLISDGQHIEAVIFFNKLVKEIKNKNA